MLQSAVYVGIVKKTSQGSQKLLGNKALVGNSGAVEKLGKGFLGREQWEMGVGMMQQTQGQIGEEHPALILGSD